MEPKCRRRSGAVVVAMGANSDGRRELLGVKLVITDAHIGLSKAIIRFAAGAWNPKTNTTLLHSITLLFKSSSLKLCSVLGIFAKTLKQLKCLMAVRASRVGARDGLMKLNDNQRKIHLQREKEKRRNDTQLCKLRERLKSQAEQKANRKD
jgi:hypothetical protein